MKVYFKTLIITWLSFFKVTDTALKILILKMVFSKMVYFSINKAIFEFLYNFSLKFFLSKIEIFEPLEFLNLK